MARKILMAAAMWFMAGCFALSGTIDPNTPDSKHVEYGLGFHCVGQFFALDKEGKMGVGSCVAIKDKVVLTAGHAVHEIVSSHVRINGKEIRVLKHETPIGFHYGKKSGGDIAICFLKEGMGLDFYPELYEKNDEIGMISSISGYGMHGTFLTGGVKDDNKRRAGSNIIDQVVGDMLVVSPGGLKTELEFCITPGDSGGGLFIDNKVAGINCCVLHNKSHTGPMGKYGHDSAHTRISQYHKWIKDTVELYESGFHGNEFIAKDINSTKR